MNSFANCPGCGLRGRLPAGHPTIETFVCPNCKAAVRTEYLRPSADPPADGAFPIWVDGTPGGRALVTPVPAREPEPAPEPEPEPPPPPAPEPVAALEPERFTDSYFREEGVRFEQYVTARLKELQVRRKELVDAEYRFEALTMEKKQQLYRAHGAVAADVQQFKAREAAVREHEAALAVREAALQVREAELAAREARVARAEARAVDVDRRHAELRAAIDHLDAGRAALAEERVELARRAEALDRAEMAMHRRFAELDELVS
jgi:hypothetical protein